MGSGSDAWFGKHRIKVLTIVEDFTKEAIDLVADFGSSGHYVTRILSRAARFHGGPIRSGRGLPAPALALVTHKWRC
ncbi:hypothetical protein D3871_16565 [Noviherbaspirillum saxi]|uniref:Uncharacterized protein n=1 Tax=Noviherbaspirillum saxi TaxID=2320863 RepID=A0A3A3G0W9_9BURK|nr:hypothetical protein D3871_16565 [Noviherbaspirillum saxi]